MIYIEIQKNLSICHFSWFLVLSTTMAMDFLADKAKSSAKKMGKRAGEQVKYKYDICLSID